MNRRAVVGGLVAVLLAGTGVAARAVSADPFGRADAVSGTIPDDLVHTYCFPAATPVLAAEGVAVVHEQMATLDHQTDYSVRYEPTCTPATDVLVVGKEPDGVTWGGWRCEVRVAGSDLCDQGRVRLDVSMLAPDMFPPGQFRKTTCHEIGHSVGLSHGWRHEGFASDDCMQNGSPLTSPHTYDAHHVAHINARTPADG